MRTKKNIRFRSKSSKRILTESAKIITLSFIISTLCFVPTLALSAQENVDVQFTFNPSLSLSLSSPSIHIDNLTPGNYANSNTIRINVETNNAFGYTLAATVGDEDVASNELIMEDSEAVFSSLGSNAKLTLSNFDPNYWGYTTATSVDSSSLYSGLVYNENTTINKTMNPTGRPYREYSGTNTTNFTIGASASNDQFTGEYTNVIGFEAIANIDTDVHTFMQDITKAQLAILLPNTGDSIVLTDKRDYNEYQVTNIDDVYWMTQNLRITGTVTATLSNFTGADFNISAGDLTSGNSYTEARSHYDGNTEYGAYYNYCAASAGTICNNTIAVDAATDICPFGWRMPTQTKMQAIADNNGDNWNITVAGYYNNGTLNNAGLNGGWWSSSVGNASSHYNIRYNGDWEVMSIDRRRGRSIRCIKANN